MDAAIRELQRTFGAGLDAGTLQAVLEMHGGDARAATRFLQGPVGDDDGTNQPAFDAQQLAAMAQSDGTAADYPLPAGGCAAVLRQRRTRLQSAAASASASPVSASASPTAPSSSLASRAISLKGLFCGPGSDEASVGAHFAAQRDSFREYAAVLLILLKGNVEITKAARPRILAAAWALGNRTLPQLLLHDNIYNNTFQLPHVLGALHVLDAPRRVRALEKRLARLELHNAGRLLAKEKVADEFRRRAKGEADASGSGSASSASTSVRAAALTDKTAKTKVATIARLKKEIAELQRESGTLAVAAGGASKVGGVSGALQRHIQRWARTLTVDQLVYLSLSMPPEPWQELADLIHLSPKRDFAAEWFLPRAFGKATSEDCAVAIAERIVSGQVERDIASGKLSGTIGDVYAELCEQHKLPYNFLRLHIKPLPSALKLAVSRYAPVDTCVWFHEEIANDRSDAVVAQQVNATLAARMRGDAIPGSDCESAPELPTFGYGKLMERLLYFLTVPGGGELAEALIPLAEERLATIARGLQLEAPVVVLGDASYSMDVAIRTSTVIASVIAAAAKAELKFFTDKSVDPKIVPTTVREVLEVAASVRADGQTAPAAALWPYFEKKQVVRCFVVVTDEIENSKYRAPTGQQFYFPELFAKYRAEVFPAQLVMVSFLDDPSDANKLGRMVASCEHLGCPPLLSFSLDARRPDLQKLDTILGMLQAETSAFPRMVQRLAGSGSGTSSGSALDKSDANAVTTRPVVPVDPSAELALVLEAFDRLRVSVQIAPSKLSEDDNSSSTGKAESESSTQARVAEDRAKLCIICEEYESDTVLLNCGHAMFCQKCAESLSSTSKECPVCRQQVVRTLRIFQ